jgi:hypothetical protein
VTRPHLPTHHLPISAASTRRSRTRAPLAYPVEPSACLVQNVSLQERESKEWAKMKSEGLHGFHLVLPDTTISFACATEKARARTQTGNPHGHCRGSIAAISRPRIPWYPMYVP